MDPSPTPADWTAIITAIAALIVAITNLIRTVGHLEPKVRANSKQIVQLSETVNGKEPPPPP
jgi:hypothetical protein